MKTYFLLVISFSLLQYNNVSAQEIITAGDTIFNQTDEHGQKQGYWKKYYENGKLRYRGNFLDDNPRGEFRYYYNDGALKSVMQHEPGTTRAIVTHYYRNGKTAAKGYYSSMKKDSTWKYYSYYGGYLSYIENYHKGLKNGLSIKYYEDGNISQELMWKDGIKNGKWKIWFSNGQLRLSAGFLNARLNGDFVNYYPDGTVEISGVYKDDLKVGIWKYTDPKTKKSSEINYINGIAGNRDELDREFELKMLEYEKNKGEINDPDLNDVNFNNKRNKLD